MNERVRCYNADLNRVLFISKESVEDGTAKLQGYEVQELPKNDSEEIEKETKSK